MLLSMNISRRVTREQCSASWEPSPAQAQFNPNAQIGNLEWGTRNAVMARLGVATLRRLLLPEMPLQRKGPWMAGQVLGGAMMGQRWVLLPDYHGLCVRLLGRQLGAAIRGKFIMKLLPERGLPLNLREVAIKLWRNMRLLSRKYVINRASMPCMKVDRGLFCSK